MRRTQMFTTRLHQTTTQIRRALFATTVALAFVGPAHADGLRPIEAKSIDLGGVSGVAYYTVERNGFHVVTRSRNANSSRVYPFTRAAGGSLDTGTSVRNRNQPRR